MTRENVTVVAVHAAAFGTYRGGMARRDAFMDALATVGGNIRVVGHPVYKCGTDKGRAAIHALALTPFDTLKAKPKAKQGRPRKYGVLTDRDKRMLLIAWRGATPWRDVAAMYAEATDGPAPSFPTLTAELGVRNPVEAATTEEQSSVT